MLTPKVIEITRAGGPRIHPAPASSGTVAPAARAA
jgi:hypothetical protein